MDYFLLFGLIGFACIILGVLGYTITTNKIIKDQEREIEILTTDNERLRSALRGARYVKKIVYGDYKINNPEPAKVKLTNDLFKEF
jgi:hypothetical protein